MIMSTTGKKERLSRLFTYYMARKLQNRIGQNGVDLKSTLSSLMQYGAATDKTWPFAINRVNVAPNSRAIDEATQHRLGTYNWAPIDSFKDYLHKNIPIIVGLYTGKMFWKIKGPLSIQSYKIINTTDNRKYKGHAITVIGYDDNLHGGSWLIANSLGLTWGDHGIGILPYGCCQDIGESYAISEFSGITP